MPETVRKHLRKRGVLDDMCGEVLVLHKDHFVVYRVNNGIVRTTNRIGQPYKGKMPLEVLELLAGEEVRAFFADLSVRAELEEQGTFSKEGTNLIYQLGSRAYHAFDPNHPN